MRLLRLLVFLLVTGPAAAQGRLARTADARALPGGNVIATLESRTSWRQGPSERGHVRVTIDGWLESARIGGRRDTFPQSVGGRGTARLRADPQLNGRVIGVFAPGAGVRVVERRGAWTRVRREAWVNRVAFEPEPEPTPPPASAAPAAPPPQSTGTTPSTSNALRADRVVEMRSAPGSEVIGRVEKGAVVEPVARDRGWVRVRVDAWVPESLLTPADSSYLSSLRAVDLRLDPTAYLGRTVRWEVQVVGLQNADPLRKGLRADEPYLLALGPTGENAVLYVAVPPALLPEVRGIRTMSKALITATVRVGRSDPTGAPILDLRAIARP